MLSTTTFVHADEKSPFDAAWSILENADHWELLSLEPYLPGKDRPEKAAHFHARWLTGRPLFHRWWVLGTTRIDDAKTRRKLLDELGLGIKSHEELRQWGNERFALARIAGPVIYEMETTEERQRNAVLRSGAVSIHVMASERLTMARASSWSSVLNARPFTITWRARNSAPAPPNRRMKLSMRCS
jgi:hypothetical protein